MVRLGLAAVLLLTAAGVLYADPAEPDPAAPAPAGDGRLSIPDGLVGVPVTLAEPTALTVLRAGDRVDLLAVRGAGAGPAADAARLGGADGVTGGDAGAGTRALAREAFVLAVDHAAAVVLLALTPGQAGTVVSVPGGTRFAVIVRS